VPFRTYIVALALGELPYAIAAVWLGKSVVDRHIGWLLGLGVVFATLAILLMRLLTPATRPQLRARGPGLGHTGPPQGVSP
jgi:uncharacterized membrane protein YdjX (TVP38/TMEM64 family)